MGRSGGDSVEAGQFARGSGDRVLAGDSTKTGEFQKQFLALRTATTN
jgi:hypothetical protein